MLITYEELKQKAADALTAAAAAVLDTDEFTAGYKLASGTNWNKAAQLVARADFYNRQAESTKTDHHADAAQEMIAAAQAYALAAYNWDFMTQGFNAEDAEERAEEQAKAEEETARGWEHAAERTLLRPEIDSTDPTKAWAKEMQADAEEERAEHLSHQAHNKRRQADRISRNSSLTLRKETELRQQSQDMLKEVRRHRKAARELREAATKQQS